MNPLGRAAVDTMGHGRNPGSAVEERGFEDSVEAFDTALVVWQDGMPNRSPIGMFPVSFVIAGPSLVKKIHEY